MKQQNTIERKTKNHKKNKLPYQFVSSMLSPNVTPHV